MPLLSWELPWQSGKIKHLKDPLITLPEPEQYGTRSNGGGNWGWLGLLGLIGLADLRRGGERVNRTYYDDTKRDENIGRRAA